MRHLKRLDRSHKMGFEDIHEDDFSSRYPNVDPKAADRILHAMLPSGEMVYGLDVTHQAWSLVGRGWLTAPLRWPGLRWIADRVYLWFARNRYSISKVFTGKARCERCSLD
ncbi:MAG: DUF393 domain-containing protein [Idiomarina sp.]|nr:DUF393 domain-containing protein [Idiomarina sp.]